MASSAPNRLLDETERAIAQRLMDEINRFNLDATGIRGFHEVLNVRVQPRHDWDPRRFTSC